MLEGRMSTGEPVRIMVSPVWLAGGNLVEVTYGDPIVVRDVLSGETLMEIPSSCGGGFNWSPDETRLLNGNIVCGVPSP